ncbi:hypothetical protein FVE85_8105 [Porphyridium purpureum]|uniref:Uncharacterized protein n=1 Tax=Porphyridium purpureum TaxID=35688 RepID=A0A5J4YMX3_PORPP|nr:hypothetical protein FVE85_8105 [Porphyridium purpureum]|eukprot:POR0147..scf295_9
MDETEKEVGERGVGGGEGDVEVMEVEGKAAAAADVGGVSGGRDPGVPAVAGGEGAEHAAPAGVAGEEDAAASQEGEPGKDKKAQNDHPEEPFVLTPEMEELLKRKLPKVPKPSEEERDKACEAQKAIIQGCYDRINSVKESYEKRSQLSSGQKEAHSVEKKKLDELFTTLNAMIDEKKALTAQINDLKDADKAGPRAGGERKGDAAAGGAKASEMALMRGIKTSEELEARIRELEYKQSSQTMKITEEKKLVSDIAFLKHKGRVLIEDADKRRTQAMSDKEERRKKREELEQLRKSKDTEITEFQKHVQAQKEVLADLKAKQSAEQGAISGEIEQVDRDAERKAIKEAKEEIDRVWSEFKAKKNEWWEAEKLIRKQANLRRRVELEKTRAEREAKRLAREEELAKYGPPDPYLAEKTMIDNLVAFLCSLDPSLGSAMRSEAASEGAKAKPELRLDGPKTGTGPAAPKSDTPKEIKGKRIGKRNEEEDTSSYTFLAAGSGGAKKKGSKSNKNKSSGAQGESSTSGSAEAADSKVSLSIEQFTAFQKVGVKAPSKRSELAQTLEALEGKKTFYDNAPRDAVSAAKSPAMVQKVANVKKEFVLDDSAPMLGANVATSMEGRDPSKPSFSDVIRKGKTGGSELGEAIPNGESVTEELVVSGGGFDVVREDE